LPAIELTVVIPTLACDARLLECLRSLGRQSRRDFEVIVVDNSGQKLARRSGAAELGATILDQKENTGFGAAINAGFARSRAPFLAALNDDTVAHPQWADALLRAAGSADDIGMCASQVRLFGKDCLDSAGMLLCADGSSKQRGHLQPPSRFAQAEEVLLPSASAALYRRAMLEQIGLFDGEFFLYCEDTDLGLRARRAGWKCLYVPEAVVEHHYSHSSGGASPLKAYYTERNRLMVAIKNFPAPMLALVPFVSLARYWWHFVDLLRGGGAASRFRGAGNNGFWLLLYVLRAHAAVVPRLPSLLRERRRIQRSARVAPGEYRRLLRAWRIRAREIARF
jgi:GT2 family glycosyltransferase